MRTINYNNCIILLTLIASNFVLLSNIYNLIYCKVKIRCIFKKKEEHWFQFTCAIYEWIPLVFRGRQFCCFLRHVLNFNNFCLNKPMLPLYFRFYLLGGIGSSVRLRIGGSGGGGGCQGHSRLGQNLSSFSCSFRGKLVK